jgi:hypothetical protein
MTTKNAILRLNYTPREAHQLISFLADLQDLLWIHFNDRLQQQQPTPQPDYDDPLPF